MFCFLMYIYHFCLLHRPLPLPAPLAAPLPLAGASPRTRLGLTRAATLVFDVSAFFYLALFF